MSDTAVRTVGILGYGSVGRYLCDRILHDPALARRFHLAFVYNRDPARFDGAELAPRYVISGPDAGRAVERYVDEHGPPDLIVEVCHPRVVAEHGVRFLFLADLFIASVTALADADTAARLNLAAAGNGRGHGLYLPSGAAWGVEDIGRMNRLGRLNALEVTMTFHADSLRLHGALADALHDYLADADDRAPRTLFEGSVAEIAPLAPNNVNTMTCVALAGATLGLAGTRARLVAQKTAHEHVVEIEARGPGGFRVTTRRVNPAQPGAVTGDETYSSFLASLMDASGRGRGLHFC